MDTFAVNKHNSSFDTIRPFQNISVDLFFKFELDITLVYLN